MGQNSKYFFFLLHSPHTNTGFPPFEVELGRPIRGPLDVLKEGVDEWGDGAEQCRTVG